MCVLEDHLVSTVCLGERHEEEVGLRVLSTFFRPLAVLVLFSQGCLPCPGVPLRTGSPALTKRQAVLKERSKAPAGYFSHLGVIQSAAVETLLVSKAGSIQPQLPKVQYPVSLERGLVQEVA